MIKEQLSTGWQTHTDLQDKWSRVYMQDLILPQVKKTVSKTPVI